MPIEENLNKILKEMWHIDEAVSSGQQINDVEKEFYNANLETIVGYYKKNNDYWNTKKILS